MAIVDDTGPQRTMYCQLSHFDLLQHEIKLETNSRNRIYSGSRVPYARVFIWQWESTLVAYLERRVLSPGNTMVYGTYQENNVYRKYLVAI